MSNITDTAPMNPLDTLDIFSGVFGGVTAGLGGVVLLVPRVSAAKWSFPVLSVATLVALGLLIYQIISLIIASRTPRPPVTWTPEPYIAPAPAQLPPLQPPMAVPFPQPQPQPTVTGQPGKPGETMTFNSMEEFQQWIAQQQPPKEQPRPTPAVIQKPEPLPQTVPSKSRDRVPSSSKQPTPTPQATPPPPAPVVAPPAPPPSSSRPALPQGSIDVTGSSLTSNEAMQMLEAHNKRRAKYGTPPLTWDPEIARSAQAWSDRQASMGQMQHEDQDKYGENLSWSSGKSQTPEDVVYGWADEEEPYYDYATNDCKGGGQCLHFTQVIWKDTTRVGCGKTKSGRQEFYTCRYQKPGNFNMSRGNRPY